MKKKLMAMVLAASAALAPALCTAANKVSYYDPTDSASPHKEVDCTRVSSSTLTLTPGWYAVDTDVTMGRITVNGSGVNLILCDGATLNATNGVRLTGSNSLTIYGQRQGTGALFALWPKNYCAGIGGNDQENGGTLTVNGGRMKVWGGQYGAAIGGGRAANGGKLVVNGGTIIAEGYNGSAAIGGGDDGSGGEVEINGGHVTAIGSRRSSTGQASAGIGAGRPHPESDHSRTSGTVKITGGTVIAVAGTAQGSGKAAQAIGVNLDDKGKDTGSLTLGHMMVFSPTNAVTPCAVSNRTEACRQTGSVRIESCTHDFENDTCSWCGVPIPTISNVFARQRWPWNGLVDITCTVSGIDGTFNGLEFSVAAVMDSGDVHNATHLWTVRDGKKSASRSVSTNGNYHLLWDAGADLGTGGIHSNVVVRVTAKGHARVQLWEGGPYWATTNVGAEKPEDYGYYFWWGDTVGYRCEGESWVATDGSVSGFSFEEENTPTWNKNIGTLKNEGWITADGVLAPEHDAAHVHWGGGWRMPTQQELDDLVSKCNWKWTTVNSVQGWIITGKDSASIFLPAAGYGYGTSLSYSGSYGYYWSSVPDSDDDYDAWDLDFYSGSHDASDDYYRYGGQSVRPVQGFTSTAVSFPAGIAGDSAPILLDTMEGPRNSLGDETLTYSSLWNGGDGATVTIEQDGEAIAVNLTGEGERAWSVPYNGTYKLTHTTYTNGVASKAETVTFVVTGKKNPPEVKNVVARQRWPWNGLVDITCTVSGIDGTDYGLDFAVAAVMPDSSVHNATNFWVAKDGKKSFVWCVPTNGNYRLIWDARADLGPELYSNVVVRVTVVSGHARAQLWEGGPYWAMTNVGAENPEGYGLYFWWGDTVGYKHENGKWVASDGSSSDFNFSNANSAIYTFGKDIATLQSGNENEKWITADGVLAPAHDAAQAHWGGGWRMPTKQELDDLVSKCNWVWTTVNGVDGYTITGKDSASIFLPCAGYGSGTSLSGAGSDGTYWSSVPSSDDGNAWNLYFYLSSHYTDIDDRDYGQSVRPVQGFTSTAVSFPAGIAGDSAPILLDTLEGPRNSLGDETLTYSSLWDGGDGATVTIEQAGEAVAENLTGEGEWAWSVPYNGTYKLTHITCANGETGKVETAWFIVTGKVDPPAVVSFDEAAYSVDEGGTLEVVVKGGNATMPSRVAVNLSYLTAAAADLDLKNGAVDGVTPKGGLKFPLLLAWDAGDKAPKRISIPVKADKTVEGYESFVLQLAERVGMGPGETVTAWATIADKNDKQLKPTVSPYKPKKGETVATNEVTVGVSPSDLGFAAGSGAYTAGTKLTMVAEARPGCAFVGWEPNGSIESDKPKYQIVVSNDVAYTAKFAAVDYMCGLADPADGGKVTGSGFCPAGKKVTLKAAANKNFAFLGWRQGTGNGEGGTGNGYVATTASLVIDRTAKPAKDSKTSTTISNLTESTTFYAVFTGDPLVSAIPVLDDGVVSNEVGKVTGAGRYAPGKKVTLKATANKGFAFSGFFDAEGNLLDETRSASYSFEMGDEDVPLTARFVTVDADKGSMAANVDGWELEPWVSKTETHAFTTNVWAGVSLAWPLAASALSQTTVKVAGLPAGLKFTAKDILKKGSKTEVDVPANTIYGAPTAASKTDKDGNPVPSTVKVTVTTAGKSSATYEIALTVDPLPEWAVGTFDGATYVGDSAEASGLVQAFTVAANGKISGKMLRDDGTWTLAADSFASYDAENAAYRATVIGKNGKLLETNEVTVAAIGVSGSTASEPSLSWTAYQNFWKRADTKAAQPVFKSNIPYELGDPSDANNMLTLTFKKDGAVSFSGKIDGASVSGSSQLVNDGEGWKVTLYAPPKPTARPPFAGFCKTFAVTLTIDANVVTDVEVTAE